MKINFGEPPKLHRDILLIPLIHYSQILKAFHHAMALNTIDHLSINIINPTGELVCFSSTPLMNYYLFRGELWRHDFSIYSGAYRKRDFYWWEECYDPEVSHILVLVKQAKFNLNNGFLIAKKVNGFHIIYSFASNNRDPKNRQVVKKYRKLYEAVGDRCYNKILKLYKIYSCNFVPPKLKIESYFHRKRKNDPRRIFQMIFNESVN